MTQKNNIDAIAEALPTFEDDAAAMLSLRAQAALDPPKGCPMKISPGEDAEEIDPAQWRNAGYMDRRTGLPMNCPVTPLGKLGDVFFFLNTLGEVHTLAANAGKGHIDALFAGRPNYLCWAWPQWSVPRSKEESRVVKNWAAEEARQDLFAACAYKGVFELEDRVRGRGAWRDDDGGVIYHAGDAVLIQGKWRPPGEHGRFIYPGRPKIGRPAAVAEATGEGSPGDVLLQGLRSWNWERGELDALLFLGWLMTAKVGGALSQRPIVFITGGEGSGKSTLQGLGRYAMNGALLKTSNTTQAGIYQVVRQDSVAVMVDEMEAKDDTRTTDKIIELARIAYSGDKMQRGGENGVGREFAVMSSFLFSSIAKPAMGSQDASRMAVLQLRDLEPGDRDVLGDLGLKDAKTVQAIGQQLLLRMLKWSEAPAGISRWDALLNLFRKALREVGHDARSADTFGALAAGAHVALHDAMPDSQQLEDWQALLRADVLIETATREKSWRKCFTYLLDAQPDVWRTYAKKSVGQYLLAWRDTDHFDDVETRLPEVGLTISWPHGEAKSWDNARLFVPTKHPALYDLFKGTSWAGRLGEDGPWAGVLRLMPEQLRENGKCDKGLDKKRAGLFVSLADALEV